MQKFHKGLTVKIRETWKFEITWWERLTIRRTCWACSTPTRRGGSWRSCTCRTSWGGSGFPRTNSANPTSWEREWETKTSYRSSTFIRPYLSENVRQQTELLAELSKPLESSEGSANWEWETNKKLKTILLKPSHLLLNLIQISRLYIQWNTKNSQFLMVP